MKQNRKASSVNGTLFGDSDKNKEDDVSLYTKMGKLSSSNAHDFTQISERLFKNSCDQTSEV